MTQEDPTSGVRQQDARLLVSLQKLEPGQQVKLRGDGTGEITSNDRDGYWVTIRYLTCPEEPSKVGTEEMVYADDVLELLP